MTTFSRRESEFVNILVHIIIVYKPAPPPIFILWEYWCGPITKTSLKVAPTFYPIVCSIVILNTLSNISRGISSSNMCPQTTKLFGLMFVNQNEI
jgi:hypothetical protein